MSSLIAYLRERVPARRFGPLALFVGLLGGPPTSDRALPIGLAFVLVTAFRIRDDLADRSRDAASHPERVLVRASTLRPFVLAVVLGVAIGFAGLVVTYGLARGLALLVFALAFELAYGLELPGRHRWVLLKYPIFAALLADALAPTLAGLTYLGFVVHERIDDPELRARPDAGRRLAAYLGLAAALAWLHLRQADAAIGWFVVVGAAWGLAFAAARRLEPLGRVGVLGLTALLWLRDHVGPFHGAHEYGPFAQALWLALPVTLAGLTHVIVIERDLFPRLAAIRLDGGLSLRGRPLFGANKTLRGAIAMIGASVVWTVIVDFAQRSLGLDDSLRFIAREQLGSVALGLLLGIAYILGELPNSLVKRQLDIEPGGAGRGSARWLVWLIDQLDSAAAILAALCWFRVPSPAFVLALTGLTMAVHPIVAALMVALGLKGRIG